MNRRNELQEPGAGLPGIERLFLSLGLKLSATVFSAERALNAFLKDADVILEMVEQNDIGFLSQTYLIPKMVGIEDSSRNWSVLMVIDHLCITNRMLLNIVSSLVDGYQPRDQVLIENLKPDADADMMRVEDFRLVNQEIERFVLNQSEKNGSLRTEMTHEHPWFGQLDGHQWICLAAAHQRIHRRQCRKILTMIGMI